MKNLTKTIAMLILAWLVLPTGPTDVFIIPWIIGLIGTTGYLILSAVLIIWIYKTIEGRTIGAKLKNIEKDVRNFLGI